VGNASILYYMKIYRQAPIKLIGMVKTKTERR